MIQLFLIQSQSCVNYHYYLLRGSHEAIIPQFPIPTNFRQPLIYFLSLLACLFWMFHVILSFNLYTGPMSKTLLFFLILQMRKLRAREIKELY